MPRPCARRRQAVNFFRPLARPYASAQPSKEPRRMRTKILLGTIFAGLLATAYAFTVQPGAVDAAELKNLKVFPPNTTKADIKKSMKKIADALGVQCDHCHNMDDMSADTPKKEKAREMMRMAAKINAD